MGKNKKKGRNALSDEEIKNDSAPIKVECDIDGVEDNNGIKSSDMMKKDNDVPIESKKATGKSKKSRKKKDDDDDGELDQMLQELEAEYSGKSTLAPSDDINQDNRDVKPPEILKKDNDVVIEPKKSAGKSKKSRKKKDDDDDGELDQMLQELKAEYSGKSTLAPSEDNNEDKKDVKPTETIKKSNDVPIESKKATGKSKKSRKKKDDDDDGELDQMLQELEAEYSGKSTLTPSDDVNQDKKNVKPPETIKKDNDVVIEPKKSAGKSKKSKKTKDDDDDGQLSADHSGKNAGTKTSEPTIQSVPSAKVTKGPGKKVLAAMQEALRIAKEQEEQMKRDEENRIKMEEERENQRLLLLKAEQEKREKKKLKEKERKERLKSEGKYLTAKQKADRARAQLMLDTLRAQGIKLPTVNADAKKTKVVYTSKPKKKLDKQKSEETEESVPAIVKEDNSPDETSSESEDSVKDAWDDEVSSGDDFLDEPEDEHVRFFEDDVVVAKPAKKTTQQPVTVKAAPPINTDHLSAEEIKFEKAKERIRLRRELADQNRSTDNLRAPIICVLGHVDTGKTKILDRLRRTNVQDGEAGGITQQIGATNVPAQAIIDQVKITHKFDEKSLKVPGLLIIDTPGHESFSNLRSRGSSLCDIAILVVDIMHGLEPQTIESINLLKSRKTPFVVALNKIDRLYDWEMVARKDIRDVLKSQTVATRKEFEKRSNDIIVQFAEQKLNARLFYENADYRTYIQMVPTSAITGEGMGNLLGVIVRLCQVGLAKRLMYCDELKARVLEVKAISGLGTTIDVILINGVLREGDSIILAGTDGPFVTQVRSLLMPEPLRELRVKSAFKEHREVKAAQGVKIAAKDLEKAIAGLNLLRADHPDEIEPLKAEIAEELKKTLQSFKLQERGVYVQASTLGSLEALLEFLRTSEIPYSGVRIGPVAKRDVMKASIMLEHNSLYAVILAFDVKIDRDAQELADNLGVKIFQADIIYHLFDKFIEYQDNLKTQKRDQFKHIAVFPCKLKVLPQYMFNSRDPIVCGVIVEAGVAQIGTPICVPSREFVDLGVISSIESNHKVVERARKGEEVCIKIEATPGDAPKMFGRHFDETDFLVSKISRQSIDVCKEYFRDDLTKADWQLIIELKKTFEIV